MELPDIKQSGKKFTEGVKQIPSQNTLWMVAGAGLGLLLGVMAMHSWLGNKPSLTTYIYPSAPIPTGGY